MISRTTLNQKSNGSRDVSTETLWFKGNHEAIVTEELYNHCQVAREKAARHHLPTPNTIEAIGDLLGNEKLKERVMQIEEMIKWMDFRRDNGFITDRDEYLQKRLDLQQELEQLKPVPMDELEAAADILKNFESYWEKAEGNPTEQQRPMHLIFERIWIKK